MGGLDAEGVVVGEIEMLADAGANEGGTLCTSLFEQDVGHNLTVGLVEMADGLVSQEEIKRLAEGADKCDALLLPERHLPH